MLRSCYLETYTQKFTKQNLSRSATYEDGLMNYDIQ